MRKTVIFVLAVVISSPLFAESPKREYLISGQNSVQKIYYQTSSNFSKNHSGKMAMDDDPDTVWLSEKSGDAQWIEIDFGIKRLMSGMVIRVGKKDNYRTVRGFTVQFYYMNKWFDYRKISCENTDGGYSETFQIDLGGVDASKFRIYVPAGMTYDGYCAIAEIGVFVGAGKIRYYDSRLRKLAFPIKNGFLPPSKESYPNAPRAYRGGRHAGVDILYYHTDDSYDPVPVSKRTPILAAGDGIVVRADYSYVSLTPSEWKKQSEYYQRNPHTFDARSFGGRQVWIDHGDGVVTAYNHMSSIDPSVKIGGTVAKGQVIGMAGNSGLLGDAEGKDWGTHLHFEIWVDSYFLGNGMTNEEVVNYLKWIFFTLQ
jgi:hypothetical protein